MTADGSLHQHLAVEIALLAGEWQGSLADALPLELSSLVQDVIEGRLEQVLSHERVKGLFEMEGKLPVMKKQGNSMLPLLAGVALLHVFVQVNWTGPFLKWQPGQLFTFSTDEKSLNDACISALTFTGEPIYHLTKYATCLYLARSIFDDLALSEFPSIASWRLRTLLVQLRVMDDPVPIDPHVLDDVEAEIVLLKKLPENFELTPEVVSCQRLLIGHYHRILAFVLPTAEKQASLTFLEAAKLAGLEYELTGRLGKRTKFQQDEKAQLVLLARGRQRADCPEKSESSQDMPETLALNDDTLLEKTQFTAIAAQTHSDRPLLSTLDPNSQPPLHPHDQALLLALSFNHANQTPGHGLTINEVAAFVARTLEQAANWSVHSMGLLLRSRLEAGRTRTVERGVLQMQSLVDQMKLDSVEDGLKEIGAPASERLKYFHDLALPAKWELERELARRYLNIGAIKSALEIFERLELWEDVARCYASIDQPEKGVKLIKALLQGDVVESDQVMAAHRQTERMSAERQAKLWCTLGDLERDPEHYRRAWTVSNKTASRAMRSLGGHYFAKGEYKDCSTCLRLSLAINPLFVKSWFILGCSDMRQTEWKDAEHAFGRCIALDEEDAESWNNLASVHMRLLEADEGNGDHKKAAFNCLKQAVRHKRDSWRIWQNYMVIAVDVGELAEACRALRRLVEMRGDADGDKSVDLPVLVRLVDAVTQDTGAMISADSARGLAARVDSLFKNVLILRFSTNSQIFFAYARLLNWQGKVKESVEYYIKAFQNGPYADASSISSRKTFQEACTEVQDLVDILRNMGSKEVNGQPVYKDWKYQAKTILRSFLGRSKLAFEDEPEFERLTGELEELKLN